ncbi:MAG TPA: recombinase family protein [Longimicrobiaceae bacterium]|nr:recombinase family protein [Longimicrobiaceae bacterium]
MLMQMVGAFAELEREMIRERTRAGPARARAEGRVGGRRPKLTPRQEAVELVASGRKSAAEVARLFGVHRSTMGRLLGRSRPLNRRTGPSREPSRSPVLFQFLPGSTSWNSAEALIFGGHLSRTPAESQRET